jgi:predicted metal-dependent RNase
VQKGLAETLLMNSDGKLEIIKVNLRVEAIEGFSGHSDRRQIVNFIRSVAPTLERIIVCHGEKAKCLSMAGFFQRTYKTEVMVPSLLETIRLR